MTDNIPAPRPLTLDVGAVETSAVALHEHEDGTLYLTAQRFAVRQLELRSEALGLDFASLAVSGLAARLAKPTDGGPAYVIDGSADEVRLEGMNAFVGEAPIEAAARGGSLRLDALAELGGMVRAFLTDALWIIDAEIVVPVARGAIDFNRVVVEHIGPNSSMSIGPRSVHIDAPNRSRIDLFTFGRQGVPGASLEAPVPSPARGRDRGRLELAAFLRAALGAPTGERFAKLADPALERPLRGARVAGDLQLGDGALGTDAHHVVLSGRAAGKNRIEVAAAALGERILFRAPALAASAATFALARRALAIGRIAAALELHVIGRDDRSADARDSLSLAIVVRDAALHDVRLS